jgi:putative transposase
MPRVARSSAGGLVYHVLNRGNARSQIFDDDQDYEMFEDILWNARPKMKMRILAYCLMPNHWHLVLWPREDGDLSRFMFLISTTHTQRWHARRESHGMGHLYQGRYKSFPVQADDHFLTVCRYVERNALRAGLVRRAENWRWCSLWRREKGPAQAAAVLSSWPVDPPGNWVQRVNTAETAQELERIRRSLDRNRPYGSPVWQVRTARRLGLESTIRPRGRPKKKTSKRR